MKPRGMGGSHLEMHHSTTKFVLMNRGGKVNQLSFLVSYVCSIHTIPSMNPQLVLVQSIPLQNIPACASKLHLRGNYRIYSQEGKAKIPSQAGPLPGKETHLLTSQMGPSRTWDLHRKPP